MANETRAVTMADLGRLLGLDKSSVSLALRDSPRIAPETRAKVRAAAARCGYRLNLAARQLQRGAQLRQIGIFLPSSLVSLVGPTAMRTIQSLAHRAAARGLLFQLLVAGPEVDGDPVAPDAALLWGDMPLGEAAAILRRHPQAVVLDPNHVSWTGYPGPSVTVDNEGVGATIARHLWERGARRLLLLTVDEHHLGHQARVAGARRAWEALGAAPCTALPLEALRDDDLQSFVASRTDGAIFCTNDLGGVQIARRLQRLGIAMPRQVRLASVDGEAYARVAGLTTAAFDHDAVAAAAFALAEDTTASPPPIPFPLIVGETT